MSLADSPFNPKNMKARFWELQDMKAAKTATALREQRDLHVNQARAIEDQLNKQIKEHEAGLVDIDREIAIIARAMGNFVGVRAEMGTVGSTLPPPPIKPVPAKG